MFWVDSTLLGVLLLILLLVQLPGHQYQGNILTPFWFIIDLSLLALLGLISLLLAWLTGHWEDQQEAGLALRGGR